MILNGRAIADDIYRVLRERRTQLAHDPVLGIIVAGHDPVIEQFVRIKTRAAEQHDVQVRRADLAQTATTEDVIVAVHDLVPTVDAIIVQLPLPRTVDVNATLAEIPRHKDVDVINPFHANDVDAIDAPVALAVLELLARGHVDPAGKRAVVVGAGRLVGAPTAKLLKKRGAEVSMFTLEEGSIEDLKVADIIVCGAGNPGFIKPEHIKEGVAIIDAGASESEGVIRGDADPACAEKASVFTPVPGGVGPVAVAKIFENLFTLVNAK